MSSTTPVLPSNVIVSPIRIGWVIASSTPATALASVARAAKPTTRPSTADELRCHEGDRHRDDSGDLGPHPAQATGGAGPLDRGREHPSGSLIVRVDRGRDSNAH